MDDTEYKTDWWWWMVLYITEGAPASSVIR